MSRLVALILVLLLASTAGAQEIFYVIKTSSSLVYLDAGMRTGAQLGETYLILSEQKGRYAQVAEARVVRLFDDFCIAEILWVEPGKQVEVLQRAIAKASWEALPKSQGPRSVRHLSLHLIAGGEGGRRADLKWNSANILVDVDRVYGLGLGLRLGSALSRHWRLNASCRTGLGGDLVQVGLEGDLHLVLRGCDRSGPYLGAGIGVHHLRWQTHGQQEDSANRLGANLLVGFQSSGTWSLLLEGGYQWVRSWRDRIDASHLRTYAGVGRNF